MITMPKKYKGYVIPGSVRPPTRKITMLDFSPRTWACLADPNINNTQNVTRREVGNPTECKEINQQFSCNNCAFNFNTQPQVFLEWLVENNVMDKGLALQILLTKETTGDKI